MKTSPSKKVTMPAWIYDAWKFPKGERSKFKSRTFRGIANAMADQWNHFFL